MNRRTLIGAAITAVAAAIAPKKARAEARIRPPGALQPGAFERACIGCYRCAEVCPPLAIRFPARLSGQEAIPYLDTRDRACILCMKCTEVCPTGALTPISPELKVMAEQVRMGVPKLKRDRCLPWSGAGTCRLCHEVCPYADAAVELVGPQLAPQFHAEACVGCGLCEEACPEEAQAIRIVPEEKK